ncbi:ankyrin repeat-containing protein BDA1-like [Musa acuminata AAA Group]|uniref:ankyrin repeat-containing protein BDA1-like n=1 Tax=Musa acuminata AAA Group TaxID=214697 RepID=UPI0031E1D385
MRETSLCCGVCYKKTGSCSTGKPSPRLTCRTAPSTSLHRSATPTWCAVNPELAHGRNSEGLSALHLAAAQGHLSVVNELLQYAAAANLCLATDNDGLMPAHNAALRGRLDVLTVLLDACPESARAVTSQGDSILHLTVKSNSFETVQLLLNRTDENDELLNSGDAKGNTVLHLAVARKQLQVGIPDPD